MSGYGEHFFGIGIASTCSHTNLDCGSERHHRLVFAQGCAARVYDSELIVALLLSFNAGRQIYDNFGDCCS